MQVAANEVIDPTVLKYAQTWIWRALFSLIQVSDFDPSPRWIANRLDTTVEKIVDALEGLQRLGLIEKQGSTYKAKAEYLHINTKHISSEELLSNHVKIVPQILSRLDARDAFTTQFLTGNRKLLDKYGPRFMALYEEMSAEAVQLGITDIIASELSFVQMTKPTGDSK